MIDIDRIPKEQLNDESIHDDESKWTIHNVHDPSIYKDGEWYYVFSTDAQVAGTFKAGIQIRKSRDLIHWEWVGRAFSEIPKDAKEWTGAKGLWAPEITKYGDTYYLYYSASQFGKNQSFIGLATSKHIEGPWIDQGEVVKTKQGPGPNAIDANITFDRHGQPWMVYGSFFAGIHLKRMNPSSGKPLEDGIGKLIAKRSHHVEGAIEGPYITYHPQFDYYYLFVSYDFLGTNYHIRVARSKEIEGPYLDMNGHEMTNVSSHPNDVGTKILGSYKFENAHGWTAPGHNSVLQKNNEYFIVHHARTEAFKGHFLHIRTIVWTMDGWPLVLPERYAGEEVRGIQIEELFGEWEIIYLDPHTHSQLKSYKQEITTENIQTFPNTENHFWFNDPNGIKQEMIIIDGFDWENHRKTLMFASKDPNGHVYIGKKCHE